MAGRRCGTWDGLSNGLRLKQTRCPQADDGGILEFKAFEVLSNPCKDPPGFRGNAPPQTQPQKLDQRGLIFFNPVVPKQNFRPAGRGGTGNQYIKALPNRRCSLHVPAPPAVGLELNLRGTKQPQVFYLRPRRDIFC